MIVVADVDGNLAGFEICWLDKINRWCQLWTCAVSLPYRRMGLLSKMEDFRDNWIVTHDIFRSKANANNKRKEIIIAFLKLGYFVTGVELHEEIDKSCVYLEKKLK